MKIKKIEKVTGAPIAALLCIAALAVAMWGDSEDGVPAAASGGTIRVMLCDGETSVNVPDSQTASPSTEGGQEIADALMEQWKRKHPNAGWEDRVRESHRIVPPTDNSHLISKDGQGKGHAYGNITAQDVLIWQRETEKLVLEGARVFHSGEELGSTVGVSCDMCHPDASNTHPETYPKFQNQLGRVALLRDMINWCVQHPVRAEPLDPDGPKMRALEAYIIGQRKGVPLSYGKH